MEESVYTKKDINAFIKQLKKNEIDCLDIPKELRNNKEIVAIERKLGLRKSGRRGYEVINDRFFVEEVFPCKNLMGEQNSKLISTLFEDFECYYNFMDGDIYEHACYYQYDFSKMAKQIIDKNKLIKINAFVETTIDDYGIEPTDDELENYKNAEHIKKKCKKWHEKFNTCDTFEKLAQTTENYGKSELSKTVDVSFFFFLYIFEDVEDKNRFDVIMKYMSAGIYPAYRILNALCSIYDQENILVAYDYSAGSKQTNYKYRKKLKDYIKALNSGELVFSTRCFFDSKTHYFCEELSNQKTQIYKYFETFEEFIEYRKGDLTNCDLSNAIDLNKDFSKYRVNETTKLPVKDVKDLVYSIEKSYDGDNGIFRVGQMWHNAGGCLVKQYRHSFSYFFDFVAFLKGDLSDADLVFCDGLVNLKDLSEINLTDAKMTSKVSDKLEIQYESYFLNTNLVESFNSAEENEKETVCALQSIREIEISLEESIKNQKVYYITDLHLMHRIQNAGCKSKEDILYVIGKAVSNIVKNISSDFWMMGKQLILIGGDTSSEIHIFELFIKMLKTTMEERKCQADIVFLLGNHELWEFPGENLANIINKYSSLIQEYGMYLLQNDILYKDSDCKMNRVTTKEILSLDKNSIRESLRNSRIVLFGGLAFSGYNKDFNANQGIYRLTVDRETEVKETQKFESLYDIVCEMLSDKNLIVFTHMPRKDWCENPGPQKDFVYVSGHTHRNCFYDDGEYRNYADNQVGYYNENPNLKYFYLENEYDYFLDYKDGIYEITGNQYNDFYRGKNIQMNFTREVNILYMLKKYGYYCFIHKSKDGSLTILNGGALKKLDEKDVHYYYDNMDQVVAYIKKPLDAFTQFQEQISDEIKKIGGSGTIHGSIIDIDFYNHVYVNPTDMTVTGYWAQDIISKQVYPSVPVLLKEKCPKLYDRYQKLLTGNKKNPIAIKGDMIHGISVLPETYLDTDIYKASREIKKMQKLSSNILSVWYKLSGNELMIERRNG
jgi:hypothetical protein